MTQTGTATKVTTYRVERAELTRGEYAAGLVPAWNVIATDANGSYVAKTLDTRALATDAARRLRSA